MSFFSSQSPRWGATSKQDHTTPRIAAQEGDNTAPLAYHYAVVLHLRDTCILQEFYITKPHRPPSVWAPRPSSPKFDAGVCEAWQKSILNKEDCSSTGWRKSSSGLMSHARSLVGRRLWKYTLRALLQIYLHVIHGPRLWFKKKKKSIKTYFCFGKGVGPNVVKSLPTSTFLWFSVIKVVGNI